MLNIPASVWGYAQKGKPNGEPDVRTYIPVQGDTGWAIFIAGQLRCHVTFRCPFCAAENQAAEPEISDIDGKLVVIGYR